MSMTVLNVAYPFSRVSPETAGGAEQVLAMLDEALVEAGHSSIVLAPEGSSCKGRLISFRSSTVNLDEDGCIIARREYRELVRETVARFSPDVVHFHGIDFDSYMPLCDLPIAVTLHLPPHWYAPRVFAEHAARCRMICVSQSQASACPAVARIDDVIENGIKLSQFHLASDRDEYVVSLGRICPEKGLHLAMDAATRCGIKLILAGTVYGYPAHRAYFEHDIRPRLAHGHEFMGALGVQQKARLLARARCLLVPSLAPETSSLVAMEAMACGTPVVAFRAGALCELVDHGRTGFLVSDVDEMAEAIERAKEINSADCRKEAEKRFSSRQMSEKYLQVYNEMAQRSRRKISMLHLPPVPFSIHVLKRNEEIEAIEPEWQSLFQRCAYATPFQRPEWLLPWLKCFPPSEPHFVVVRRNNNIIGLAPMLVFQDGHKRVLGLMGGGVSDYLDVLVAPEFKVEVLAALSTYFAGESVEWDVVDLTDLTSESPLVGLALSAGERDISQQYVCPTIDLPEGSLDLSSAVPSHQLRKFRNAQARLKRRGKSRFDVANAGNFESMLDALFRIHGKRWRENGETGVLAEPAVQKFHRAAGGALIDKQILQLHGLWVEDRYIAVLYSLVERGCAYCYMQGFDPEFSSLSPGTLILGHTLEHAVRSGLRRVDFLRGGESYKYAWGAQDSRTYRFTIREQSMARVVA